MKINPSVPKNVQFNARLLFYVISNIQIGVGIFSFQRSVYMVSRHDAWISVIISGFFAHLVMWLLVRMLEKYESADLYGIHYDLFGKYGGIVLNCLYMFYYLLVTSLILRKYVEVVQVWIFPNIPGWVLSGIILLLALYAGFGGLRVIVGVCTIGFFVILFMVPLFYSSLEYAVWTQLLPVMESSLWEVIQGAFKIGFSLAGFEIILMIYPYIHNKERTMLYSQMGVAFSTILYLIIMLISIVYFSPTQLERAVWSTINMLKIVKYPYLERLEFIVVSVWMIVAIAGIILNTWIITRGFKRMWNVKQKPILFVVLGIVLAISVNFKRHIDIERFGNWLDYASSVFSFLYPLLLSFIVAIVFKLRSRKQTKAQGGPK